VSGASVASQESLRWLRSQTISPSQAVSASVFDDAERVVMESLRRDYWESFLESEHYRKLKNFLWYRDRPVVPGDFFVMRVLGRGGFGLVNGEYSIVVLPYIHCLFARVRLTSPVHSPRPCAQPARRERLVSCTP
jgi:hypothetical protein